MTETVVRMRDQVTMRSLVAGIILAIFLCTINSYLTLAFGVMEEGPAIAALFFFAVFFLSKSKITNFEMVVVSTMGSAGGSLGFISNFYAARVMTCAPIEAGGPVVCAPYTIWEMTLFAVISSLVGLVSVVILRMLLIVKDETLPKDKQLPWVGAKAVKGVIDALIEKADPMIPRYLLLVTVVSTIYVIFNSSGLGWFPEESAIAVFGLSAFGAAILWSPFAWGGSYLMGMRTCFGFLVGAIVLMVMAHWLPTEMQATPQKYVWPGVMFLVASGITALLLHWRIMLDAMKSLINIKGGASDDDPIMSGKAFVLLSAAVIILTCVCLYFFFQLTITVILAMIVIGGLILNVIATRAAAQTYFNPARVMGVLLEGICALLGVRVASQIVAGGGFIAGSGSQGGTITNDLAYGRWYKFPSRWQFWTQAITIIPCSLVSALVFYWIQDTHTITIDGKLGPVAKVWAATAMLFDPAYKQQLPAFAVQAMIIAGIIGVIYTLLESRQKIRKFIPCSIGFGLALLLSPSISISFFLGGVLMWWILGSFLKFKEDVLNTIAIACIVGEAMGNILQSFINLAIR